jgi:DNA-binding NarL/FixJ family response regulator
MMLYDAPEFHLTPRERDVARLLIGGLPNKSIARLLGVETQTIKHHMTAIMLKTHADNRTMAAVRLVGY